MMLRLLKILLFAIVASPACAQVSAVDDAGKTITLPRPATRIISLAPHVTEILFAIGAGKQVVGASEYSDYPEVAKAIPRIGGYRSIDPERVLTLKPDLIVGWSSGSDAMNLERISRLGVPVFLTDPRHIDDLPGVLERLGFLTGTASKANSAAADFRKRYERLKQRYTGREAVSVMYEVWHQPIRTINREQMISDVIRLCGGRNVFADLPALSPTIDMEAVFAADPQVILTSGSHGRAAEWLAEWRRWPQLAAVKQDNLYRLPPDVVARVGPRIIDGAEAMCEVLDKVRAKRRQ